MDAYNTIDINNYEIIDKIDEGNFGKVFKVKEKQSGNIYAAKVSLKEIDPKSLRLISTEVNILSKIFHPFIVKFIGFSSVNFQGEEKPVILTEYLPNGSLSKIISMERKSLLEFYWSDTKKLIIIYGIAISMQYLHEHNIIHRDLKPGNILMDEFLIPKICDFGLSKIHNSSISVNSSSAIKGTPVYIAPEIWTDEAYSQASDVYAFGMIVYELFSNEEPFKNYNIYKLNKDVVNGLRPTIGKAIEAPYRDLIERCWSQEPKNRPSFSEIVENLRTDDHFTSNLIDKDDFTDFVEYVDSCEAHFDTDKQVIPINDFLKRKSISFIRVSINKKAKTKDSEEEEEVVVVKSKKNKKKRIYPLKEYLNLNRECKKLVDDASNDADLQFEVGFCLVEGEEGFPVRVDIGIRYLQEAIRNENDDASTYLARMMIKGDVIPRNLSKAEEILNACSESGNSDVTFLLGYIKKKKGEYEEALGLFRAASNVGSSEGQYEYGKLLYKGLGCGKNEAEAMKMLSMAKKNGNDKARKFMDKISTPDRSNNRKEDEEKDIKKDNDKNETDMSNKDKNRQEGKSYYKNGNASFDVNDNEVNAAGKGKNSKKRNENLKGKDTLNNKKETQNFGRRNANEKKDNEKNKEGKGNDKVDLKDKDNEDEENDNKDLRIIQPESTIQKDIGKNKDGKNSKNDDFNKKDNDAKEEENNEKDEEEDNYDDDDDDESDEEEEVDYKNEEVASMKDKQYVNYRLFKKSKIAHIIESPRAKGDVFIQDSVRFDSAQYKITRIDDRAFADSKIKSLSFAEHSRVKSIGNFAFENSTLSTISIPKSLKKIDDHCLCGASNLVEIEVNEENSNFSVKGGFVFYNERVEDKNKTVRQNRQFIFALKDFKSKTKYGLVEFKKSESTLIQNANDPSAGLFFFSSFYKCQNICHLTVVSHSKINLGKFAFNHSKNLQTVEFVGTEIDIAPQCFNECSSLSSVSFFKLDKATFGGAAFNGCSSLKELDISAASELHFQKECFVGVPNLQSVTASSRSIVVGDKCFMFCKSLSSISFTNARTIEIGLNSFSECALTEFKVSVTSGFEFSDYCFSRAYNLQSVKINGAASLVVNEGSFENCLALASVSFPDALKVTFGKSSFTGCPMLKNISIPHAKSVCFGESCFLVTRSLSSIDLSCSELTVNEDCFDDHFSFSDTSMRRVKALRLIVCKNASVLNMLARCASLEWLVIEASGADSPLILERDSFAGLGRLSSLSVACGSLAIGASCFARMQSLREVEIDCEELSLGPACFQKCQSLSKFSLMSAAYVRIGPYAFDGCTRLGNFNIQPSEKVGLSSYFTRLRCIGAKSETCLVKDKKSGRQNYRAKSLSREIGSREDASSFFKKMVTFSGLQSPSLLKQLGFAFSSIDNRPLPTIISEYIGKCSLEESFSKFFLDGTKKCIVLIGVAVGMEYLHAKGIAHGNLAPPNVLLDKDSYPHISDFDIQSGKLTRYSAPELFQKGRCSLESDVYSFSILAHELITSRRFCDNMKLSEVVDRVVARNERPDSSLIQDGSIASLLARCWSPVPSGRPRFAEILAELLNIGFIRALKASESDVSRYIGMFDGLTIDQTEKSAPKQPERQRSSQRAARELQHPTHS